MGHFLLVHFSRNYFNIKKMDFSSNYFNNISLIAYNHNTTSQLRNSFKPALNLLKKQSNLFLKRANNVLFAKN